MREIKFRAWSKSENKIFNVDVLAISECGWDCPDYKTRGVSLAYQPHIKVMQYTGLKDKNGVEIYEGDIITWLDPFGKNGVAKVIYDENLACFNTYRGELSHIAMRPNLEVIGNIYENPKLLERCG